MDVIDQSINQDLLELHAIDMSQSDQPKIVEELMFQMSTLGFCLITNVEGHSEPELLEAIKAFHALPLETKMNLAPQHFNQKNQNKMHGYFPFLQDDVSHKEFYDMARPLGDISEWEKQHCPCYEETPWFNKDGESTTTFSEEDLLNNVRVKFNQHFKSMHSIASQLLSYFAIGFGKSSDYFEPWFKRDCTSVYRAIHYNPRDQQSSQQHKLVTPEHSDSGFITLLSTFKYAGLQVLYNGEYRSVKPVENAIIVNIGDALSLISNHRIKATKHRVYDIGIERFSCPFFFDTKYSAKISPNLLTSSRRQCEDLEYENAIENQEEMSKVICYGQLLKDKYKSAYGEWLNFVFPEVSFDYDHRF